MPMVLTAHYHIPITVSSAHYLLFTDDDAYTERSRRLFLEAGVSDGCIRPRHTSGVAGNFRQGVRQYL